MNRQLRDYVRRELRNNVNPGALKYSLLNAGWPEDEVDEAIRAASQGNAKGIAVLGVLLVAIIGGVALLLVSLSPSERPEPVPPPDPNGNELTPPEPSDENDTCDEIRDATEKHWCYLELASEGFDCRTLESREERSFCFRALEYYLLNRNAV